MKERNYVCSGSRPGGRARILAAIPASPWLRYLLTPLMVWLATSNLGSACRIPVFRYALERWQPDRYELLVCHSGPLADPQQALFQQLRDAANDADAPVNVFVTDVDVDQLPPQDGNAGSPDPLLDDAVDAAKQSETAWLVLRYPPAGPSPVACWSGELTAANADRIVQSPLRADIAERILSGDSAVWVLIESSDPQKNAQALDTLRTELDRMQEQLTLPSRDVLETDDQYQAGTAVELRIGFSVVQLAREDESEKIFLQMLLHSEADLESFDEPIAVPVFGRGRTYFALVGQGINASTIEESCRFLCGDCSCQVKALNPGRDMLLAVDWEAQIRGTALPQRELPQLTGIGGLEVIDLATLERPADETTGGDAPETVPEQPSAEEATGAAADATPASETVPASTAATADTSPAPQTAAVVPGSAAADSPRSFGTTLLFWLLGGIAVAVAAVAAGSLWMRSA